MAMLAEPRQRKRYNLTPRGKALYEDDSRFGTKMLEKMGWSKGKGLGANENGSKDFVRVRMRNTNEGLGFENRDDHWTAHEQSFTGLLKQLNGGEEAEKEAQQSDVEGTATVGFGFKSEPVKLKKEKLKEKFSGESLEEKSKRSKARVHYKKFTRGKDLTQYSEKDLANIFGKKVVEEQQADGIYQQFTAVRVADSDEEEVESKEKHEMEEHFAGVQTISTGLSVSDYFKQKMEEMKNRRKNLLSNGEAAQKEQETEQLLEVDDKATKKEKKKKRKLEAKQEEIVDIEEQVTKSKKKKREVEEEVEEVSETVTLVDKAEKKQKKKDKAGKKDLPIEEPANALDEVELVEETPKKKNKKKRKNADEEVELISPPEYMLITEKVTKNKKNKTKREDNDGVDVAALEEECSDSRAEATNTKISKKSKINETANSTIENNATSSKKKSKKDVSAIDIKDATLDDLIAKLNTYNIYKISSFCAEKFRHVDLELFSGSSLAQINGYSFDDDMQLSISSNRGDEDRITQLWNCTINKYSNSQPKKTYYNYVKQVRAAYKTKQKLPRFKVKTWKRKNAFQSI